MKKSRGFTLIELLIVTVIIVTLMAIVFRLAGSGGDSTARAKTLARLQKLSYALSGYYAAFGSYPPVPLQGRSRDIYTEVDKYGADKDNNNNGSLGYGIQGIHRNEIPLSEDNVELRRQIEAACRAQPVAAGFPYNSEGSEGETIDAITQRYGLKQFKPISDYGGFNKDSSEWSENNVFMFGLMSFLLPRYQFMLDGEENLYKNHPNGPWESNNRLPYLLDGTCPKDWTEVQGWMHAGPKHYADSGTANSDKRTMIESLPSQAVCARWMPNLKKLVTSRPIRTVTEFYGVDTDAGDEFGIVPSKWMTLSQRGFGYESSYVNGTKTVLDGWGEDFYYYSPPPYQSYQLWSSGPNKRTFPPWMDKAALQLNEIKLVNKWIIDDIKVGDK